jgi:hypothetical protein
MKTKTFLRRVRDLSVNISKSMPIVSRYSLAGKGSRGTSIDTCDKTNPATAGRRHCRTPPADLATSSHPNTGPSGQEMPVHQSPRHNSAVGPAMPDLPQSQQTHRPHGVVRAMPDRSRSRCRRCLHQTPWMGRASDGQRAASSGSLRPPERQLDRTTAGPGHGTDRRTSSLGRRGKAGWGLGAAGAGLHTGLGGIPQSSWPRSMARIQSSFASLLERYRSRLRPCGLLAGGRQCRES